MENQKVARLTIPLRHIFLCCIMPLVLGISIYFISRPGCIIFANLNRPSVHLPRWIAYNLPDGLWLFALLNTLLIIWQRFPTERNAWLITVTAGAIGTEYLQYYKILPGTFDYKDLLAYIAAFFGSITIQSNNYVI